MHPVINHKQLDPQIDDLESCWPPIQNLLKPKSLPVRVLEGCSQRVSGV